MTANDDMRHAVDYYKDPDNQVPAGPAHRRTTPRLTSLLPIRFPEEMIAAAKRLADIDGMTVSSWIRRLVAKEIKRREPPVTATAVSWSGIEVKVKTQPLTSTAGI